MFNLKTNEKQIDFKFLKLKNDIGSFFKRRKNRYKYRE